MTAKPTPIEGAGPWRTTYTEASKDAERLCKEHVLNYFVTSRCEDNARRWRAVNYPKSRQVYKRAQPGH